MKSKKTKKRANHSVQEIAENRESNELWSEIEDLRLGMERRKFSYTIHIPERRSAQIRLGAKQFFPNPDTDGT